MTEHEGFDLEAPGARPMYPGELLHDPEAHPGLDAAASALIGAGTDDTEERRAYERDKRSAAREVESRMVDSILESYDTPEAITALRNRFGFWGDSTVQVSVRVPALAVAYLKASGTTAADALTVGLDVLARGIPTEFVDVLASPTGDGARKRAAGLKPHWKVESARDVHGDAMHRHIARDDVGRGTVDADSGAHHLAHVAWRACAVAWLESAEGAN